MRLYIVLIDLFATYRSKKCRRVTLAAMKRTVLHLLACLLLALRTVAQAPEKAAPDDLVVTAEIVGYEAPDITKTFVHSKRITEVPIYAKMTVRNMTDHTRNIFTMTCDWPFSWIADGPNGLTDVSFQPGCDHNSPWTFSIPAHEAVIFNCRLWFINGYLIEPGEHYNAKSFRLGFLDVACEADVWNYFAIGNPHIDIADMVKKSAHVYWSNTLSDVVKPGNTKKIEANRFNWYNTLEQSWKH